MPSPKQVRERRIKIVYYYVCPQLREMIFKEAFRHFPTVSQKTLDSYVDSVIRLIRKQGIKLHV